MLIQRDLLGGWPTPRVVSAHTHLMLVGGVLSIILGTGLWLYPRPKKGDPRVKAWHGELAWWGVVMGTTLRSVGEIVGANASGPRAVPISVVGGLLQVVGIIAAVLAIRPRIRPGLRGD